MGYGQYSHDAHVKLTKARSSRSIREVFKQTRCHEAMNPKGVAFRESRDSDDHPNSVSIVFALDVSGSMGEIPHALATNTLPTFMRVLEEAGVSDPQVMFMAVGNAKSDQAALQVGQFESSADLMDKWLTNMYLEGGGAGGNESYELAMYFGARHTAIDCWEKRQKRGYFFITGDEPPNRAVIAKQVSGLIGDDIDRDIPLAEIIKELGARYELFYLVPDPERTAKVGAAWRKLLGDRLIGLMAPEDTSHVAAGLVALVEGAADDLSALIDKFAATGLSKERASRVAEAIAPYAKSL